MPQAPATESPRTDSRLVRARPMSQPFYRERLESHGLSVIVPSAEDRALVHRVIG